MSTNMWSNRETMVAHVYLSKELQKDTRYTPDEIEDVFNYLMADVDNIEFLDDILDSFLLRVNWEELSEHHNAEINLGEYVTIDEKVLEALDSELLNDFKQSLKDAAEGKTFPLSKLWEEE